MNRHVVSAENDVGSPSASFFPAHFLRIADPAGKEGEYPQDDQPEKAANISRRHR